MRLIFLIITCSLLFRDASAAEGTRFSFFEKARKIYSAEVAKTEPGQSNNRTIDSLLRVTKANANFKQASNITWKIGLNLMKQGQHSDALQIFLDLRGYLETSAQQSLETQKSLSSVLNIIGAIYEETGLWNEALALYMKSLQICNQIDFQAGKAKIYNNLGKLYYNRNQLQKADELYKKAIEINKKFNIKPELFNNYNNLAGIYQRMKQPAKALEYALIALNQLDIELNFYDLSIIYLNIGSLYQDMGNYPVSLTYYQQASRIQKEKFYSDALISSYLSMASLYQALKMNDSSSFYFRAARQMADEIGNPYLKIMVFKDAVRFYDNTSDYARAAGIYKKYIQLNDSLEALNSLARMEQVQSVYEVINADKNNQILSQQIDIQKLAIQRQQIVLFAALIIFLVLALFLFNIQRLRKREKKNNELIARQKEELHQKEKEILLQTERTLHDELDLKNRQLTSHALNLARNNEFILKTRDELKQILLELTPKEKANVDRIRKILSDLHQYSTGNDWEEFRIYFEKVHQSFEKNLLAAYPDLSPNDRKMCALLKLGLSTKDIASITFRELRSVESARNRLRRKLGIAADVNIHNFLSQF